MSVVCRFEVSRVGWRELLRQLNASIDPASTLRLWEQLRAAWLASPSSQHPDPGPESPSPSQLSPSSVPHSFEYWALLNVSPLPLEIACRLILPPAVLAALDEPVNASLRTAAGRWQVHPAVVLFVLGGHATVCYEASRIALSRLSHRDNYHSLQEIAHAFACEEHRITKAPKSRSVSLRTALRRAVDYLCPDAEVWPHRGQGRARRQEILPGSLQGYSNGDDEASDGGNEAGEGGNEASEGENEEEQSIERARSADPFQTPNESLFENFSDFQMTLPPHAPPPLSTALAALGRDPTPESQSILGPTHSSPSTNNSDDLREKWETISKDVGMLNCTPSSKRTRAEQSDTHLHHVRASSKRPRLSEPESDHGQADAIVISDENTDARGKLTTDDAALHDIVSGTFSKLLNLVRTLARDTKLGDLPLNTLLRRLQSASVGVVDSLTVAHWKESDQGSHRAIVRLQSSLAGKSTVLLPAHDKNHCHWRLYCLRITSNEGDQIFHLDRYDPLGSLEDLTLPSVLQLVRALYALPADKNITHARPVCPQQLNTHDCGVYVIAVAFHLAWHAQPPSAVQNLPPSAALGPELDSLTAGSLDGGALRRRFTDLLLTSPTASVPYMAVADEPSPLILRNEMPILVDRLHYINQLRQRKLTLPQRTLGASSSMGEAELWSCSKAQVNRSSCLLGLRKLHDMHQAALHQVVAELGELRQMAKQSDLLRPFLAYRQSMRDRGEDKNGDSGNVASGSKTREPDWYQTVEDLAILASSTTLKPFQQRVGSALAWNAALVVILKKVAGRAEI